MTMLEPLDRTHTRAGGAPPPVAPVTGDETLARRALRAQVARLERRLGALAGELGRAGRAQPLPAAGPSPGAAPRLLGLAELERTRDRLVELVAAAERRLGEREASEAGARARLEAMLADPAAHRWEVVQREELGEPGCGTWRVVPRAGLLGMLLRWWRVKLSSGCP
jgi:hypothetical protein